MWPSQKEREVWAVCDQWFAEKKTTKGLTIAVIRERLKETTEKGGNTVYVSRYKKSWELAHQEMIKTASLDTTPPPDIALSAAEALRRTIETAVREEIREELEGAKEAAQILADEKSLLEAQLAELKTHADKLEKQHTEMKARTVTAEQSAHAYEKEAIEAHTSLPV